MSVNTIGDSFVTLRINQYFKNNFKKNNNNLTKENGFNFYKNLIVKQYNG